MNTLYREEAGDPKLNAQRNLMGRTHYVDNDTLRFHKSRVLSTAIADSGLLFAIITAEALDYNNTKRGCRFVIFDVLGYVVDRTSIEGAYRTREQARKAMWAALNEIDAREITLTAIAQAEHNFAYDMGELRAKLNKAKEAA